VYCSPHIPIHTDTHVFIKDVSFLGTFVKLQKATLICVISVFLSSDKNNRYFMWRPMYILDHIWPNYSYSETVSDKICRENQNIHFMFNKSFRKLCCLWDKVKKKMVKSERPQMTIWQMHIACCISFLQTHTQYMLYLLIFH
jgi:hypothetical protein